MKSIFSFITLLALCASALAGSSDRFTGPVILDSTSKTTLKDEASAPVLCRRLYLGAPIVATTNRIVASANMKTTAYTIAAQPDVARNITVTQTAVGSTDVGVPFIVTGTDIKGNPITESITSVAGSTVAGALAFKTVTSVVSPAWVINATSTSTADTVVVGVGNLIGLPVAIAENTTVALTALGTTAAASNITGSSTSPTVSVSTVDASGGTYNGTKKLFVYISR